MGMSFKKNKAIQKKGLNFEHRDIKRDKKIA